MCGDQINSIISNFRSNQIEVFHLYFGQNIEDSFLDILSQKLNKDKVRHLKIRKAQLLSTESFFNFFE